MHGHRLHYFTDLLSIFSLIYTCNVTSDVSVPHIMSLNVQDLQGYRRVPWRVWLCRLGALLSFGLLLIVFHWWPRLGVLARCCSCSLALADFVLIKVSKIKDICIKTERKTIINVKILINIL